MTKRQYLMEQAVGKMYVPPPSQRKKAVRHNRSNMLQLTADVRPNLSRQDIASLGEWRRLIHLLYLHLHSNSRKSEYVIDSLSFSISSRAAI
jgi:hypothetical protein